jgi:hypothetical protein
MQLLGTMLGILVTVTGGHASTEVPLGKGCSDGCARPPPGASVQVRCGVRPLAGCDAALRPGTIRSDQFRSKTLTTSM